MPISTLFTNIHVMYLLQKNLYTFEFDFLFEHGTLQHDGQNHLPLGGDVILRQSKMKPHNGTRFAITHNHISSQAHCSSTIVCQHHRHHET